MKSKSEVAQELRRVAAQIAVMADQERADGRFRKAAYSDRIVRDHLDRADELDGRRRPRQTLPPPKTPADLRVEAKRADELAEDCEQSGDPEAATLHREVAFDLREAADRLESAE